MTVSAEAGQRERIASAVAEYDAQGWHRTGTAVDRASGRWLADAVGATGLEARLETYGLDRFDFSEAHLEAGGRPEDGLPIFDSSLNSRLDLAGTIGPLGSENDIGLTVLDSPAAIEKYEAARRQGTHKAIVAVNIGRSPGLMARNANDFRQPFGPPVLQLSSESRAWALELAGAGAKARLVIDARREPGESANVVAVLGGREAALPPIVVTTPRSGWWQCASERGGGIAAWLEVMRGLKERETERDTWFVAYSGHELGSLGCHTFLEEHPDLVRDAKVWVHFGANVGGAREPAVRVSASQAEHLALARRVLEAAGVPDVMSPQAGVVMGQESQVVHELGCRSIALLGGNAFFHLESDRWPVAVDTASVARQANAITEMVAELDRR